MRAARVVGPGPIESHPLLLEEVASPTVSPGEIVLDVIACAVCRTDLQIAEGDLPAHRLPATPGHQIVGRVAEVGEAVAGWQPGDLAGVAWLAGACGHCRYCSSARENLCESAAFTGWDRDGGFAELATARADFAFRLPPGFDPLAAAPLLCGGVIGYRSLRVSGIQPGGRLGLFGFGASASLATQVAVYWGCEVFVSTRSPAEQDRARGLGAAWAGGYDDPIPVPLDAAVTFAPSGDVVIAALRAVAPGGTVAINAIHLDRIPQFSYDLLWRERSLRSVANFTRADAGEFLDLAAAIPIRTEISEYSLDDASRALRDLRAGNVRGAAVIRLDR